MPSEPTTVPAAVLSEWIVAHRDDLLGDVRTLVEVETPSDDRAALDRGLAVVEELVVRRLGEPSHREVTAGGEHGDVVVLEFPGDLDGPPVLLLAHYDTVWPLGTLAEIPFSLDGDVLRGPGVFDMKSGLVQAVWAVAALRHASVSHPPVRLLLNGDEEIGSPVARPVIEAEARGAGEVFVLEASGPGGALKTARKGVGLFQVHLRGVEAHAGLDPTAGASAVLALARVVQQLHAATDLAVGTSVNVGVVTGGTRPNVTAGAAWASLDVRVADPAEQARVEEVLRTLDTGDDRVTYEVTGRWNRPVMARTDSTAELFARARRLAAESGFELAEVSVGGASDGNFASAVGAPVLDGLGAVGGGAHARSEHATVSGLLQRTALLAGLLATSGAATRR
ncbi:M20 family metallopeptidase [Kineococcus sp. NPDC059986]|uniref:M20 family metallopeptidase n=1 Tax=Kineococcus sp. NPDC059986 TaxID=3155538 RepID=UPI00344C8BBE